LRRIYYFPCLTLDQSMLSRKFKNFFLIFLCVCCASPFLLRAETTILMLGDSLTEGSGVRKTQAYPYLVEQKLKAKGFSSIKVTNAGVSGSTSASALSRLKWHLRSTPDILLLALGANDGLRGLSTVQMKRNLAKTIELALSKGVRVVLAGMKMPPNYGAEYTREFEKVFYQLAKEYDVVFIPFLLEGVAGDPKLNFPDGLHPNEQGHQIIAESVYKTLLMLDDFSKKH
jgi:acyl-CoA thioesterase-1